MGGAIETLRSGVDMVASGGQTIKNIQGGDFVGSLQKGAETLKKSQEFASNFTTTPSNTNPTPSFLGANKTGDVYTGGDRTSESLV